MKKARLFLSIYVVGYMLTLAYCINEAEQRHEKDFCLMGYIECDCKI